MKKILFLLAAFFIFSACTQSPSLQQSTLETIQITLPLWPPENQDSITYPELLKWKIEISSPLENQTMTIQSNSEYSFTLQVQKNLPLCILAYPITLLENQKPSQYFLPAGGLYPYFWADASDDESISGKLTLTWEEGFSAHLMQSLCNSQSETGVTSEHINNLLQSFNWKKFQESIQKKIKTGMEEFSEKKSFYNPWNLNRELLLSNLSNAAFNTNLLTLKNVLNIQVNNFDEIKDINLLSPFIPENVILKEYQSLSFQKNKQTLIMGNNKYGILFNCSSAKKVLLDFIYMPILIDDYENEN